MHAVWCILFLAALEYLRRHAGHAQRAVLHECVPACDRGEPILLLLLPAAAAAAAAVATAAANAFAAAAAGGLAVLLPKR